MSDYKYLIEVEEPKGPFADYQERLAAYDAVGLHTIGYRKNTRRWKRGNLVLHVGDAKRPDMLMEVIGFTRDGLVKTQYIDRFYDGENRQRHYKSTSTIYKNEFPSLLDPADWGITYQTREEYFKAQLAAA